MSQEFGFSVSYAPSALKLARKHHDLPGAVTLTRFLGDLQRICVGLPNTHWYVECPLGRFFKEPNLAAVVNGGPSKSHLNLARAISCSDNVQAWVAVFDGKTKQLRVRVECLKNLRQVGVIKFVIDPKTSRLLDDPEEIWTFQNSRKQAV